MSGTDYERGSLGMAAGFMFRVAAGAATSPVLAVLERAGVRDPVRWETACPLCGFETRSRGHSLAMFRMEAHHATVHDSTPEDYAASGDLEDVDDGLDPVLVVPDGHGGA